MKSIKSILLIGFIFTQFVQIQMAQAGWWTELWSGKSSRELSNDSFLDAAKAGNLADIKLFLENGAYVNTKNNDGMTALHRAALLDRSDIIEFLLGAEARVNTKDNDDWTALHFATIKSHFEIVGLLLDAGADVDARNRDGETALHLAAGRAGHFEIVGLLLDAGADVHAKNRYGDTALNLANDRDHFYIIDLLKNWNQN